MSELERIPYASFLWKFGTTSFRTREFNKKIEWQLRLLDEFWQKPENRGLGWEVPTQGQSDIYEVKNRYYDWLVLNGFTKGDDAVKYKAAREKTSGLVDMGLIEKEHRLTEVGRKLLEIADNNDFLAKNELGISKDSEIYLKQLLKLHVTIDGKIVRPFIIVLYLLTELDHLSYDEFRYLMPLCTDEESTQFILNSIKVLRESHGSGSIENVLCEFLLSKSNYIKGLNRFISNDFSDALLLSVSMNRKSQLYDKPYINLYRELYSVFMEKDESRILPLFMAINKFSNSSISIKWKNLLFSKTITSVVKKDPLSCIIPLSEETIKSEVHFKKFFYVTMHLFKAMVTLEDYLDLNRRYLGLTNCFIFEDEMVKLDIVPKQFFKGAMEELFKQAFQKSGNLFLDCPMETICHSLKFDKSKILLELNKELNLEISTIEDAFDEVERIRYSRFKELINKKFQNDKLLTLLTDFENRNDDEINNLVTDNADIPTIFEYILGIIWYKCCGQKGKILDYLNLSLDANLLPVTHAAGGEADIVYEYPMSAKYPKHSLLLEATLADGTNQRRMEMEPVSRHLGNHILQNKNHKSYCVFATTYLDINVISDFISRKNFYVWCDRSNPDNYVEGLKIIPLDTSDLKEIVKFEIPYEELYTHFEKAYKATEFHPKRWYDGYVHIANREKLEDIPDYSIAAEPSINE